MEPKLYYSRDEMKRINIEKLEERGVTVKEIAEIEFTEIKNDSRFTCSFKLF